MSDTLSIAQFASASPCALRKLRTAFAQVDALRQKQPDHMHHCRLGRRMTTSSHSEAHRTKTATHNPPNTEFQATSEPRPRRHRTRHGRKKRLCGATPHSRRETVEERSRSTTRHWHSSFSHFGSHACLPFPGIRGSQRRRPFTELVGVVPQLLTGASGGSTGQRRAPLPPIRTGRASTLLCSTVSSSKAPRSYAQTKCVASPQPAYCCMSLSKSASRDDVATPATKYER